MADLGRRQGGAGGGREEGGEGARGASATTAPAAAVWRRRRARTTSKSEKREERRWCENAGKGVASKSFAAETKWPKPRAVPPKDSPRGPLYGNINQISKLQGKVPEFSVTTRATRRGGDRGGRFPGPKGAASVTFSSWGQFSPNVISGTKTVVQKITHVGVKAE